jgi:2-(1,2-epoxy-1,2-dihydrophenyl)acetyl-CoA isomerase
MAAILRAGCDTILLVPFVTTEDRGPVRWLTMSAPATKNAVPEKGWDEIADAVDGFDASAQRVLVVTGDGEDFCAGADLGGDRTRSESAADNTARMRRINRAAIALHRLGKPTIAAVDGVAVGAGMNLAIGCDLVIATSRARFAEIFVRRGLTIDFGGSWLLPRLVGMNKAKELALTGRIVEAEEAEAIGLVTRVVEPAELEGATTEVAESLATGAPLAQRFIKAALDRSPTMTFEQALAFEEQAQGLLLGSEDALEGGRAFREKRPPDFTGR